MRKPAIAVAAIAAVLLALAAGYRAFQRSTLPGPGPAATNESRDEAEPHQSLLYGRVTCVDGSVFEGRLRWGGTQEAFWGNYFNGARNENSWAAHVPPERLPRQPNPIEIFGFEIAARERPIELGRLFMARFGDIARIESHARIVRVILKSGATFDLNRFEAGDFDDGVRVWDDTSGVADIDSLRIRAIQFLPPPHPGSAPARLHGTVRTPLGDFTGFIQWDREQCLASDTLPGRSPQGELSLRFGDIRSIVSRSRDSVQVTRLDGRELLLSSFRETNPGSRGIYVDDPRYGRILVSWRAFERVEFTPAGSGPAYADFPSGGPLTGAVTTRAGRRLVGRLVFDLDESEITETLDAPFQGVDYTLPFGLVASIALPSPEEPGPQRARITLHSGEELELERAGDLGPANAGLLVFIDGRQQSEYVLWTEVQKIELDRPRAAYPPLAGR